MALIAFSDSEVYNDKSCSKTYLKNYETLKKQCDNLIVKLNETEFKATTYKRGLATIEDQLITFRKNEVLFSEEIAVLKEMLGLDEFKEPELMGEYDGDSLEKEQVFDMEMLFESSPNVVKETIFLLTCHLRYALTGNPTIYVSFIKQFWRTATARTRANGEVKLTATIDGQVKTITEASLRIHLKLEDNGGVTTLPNS
ncbi:hypothetical protein Tco_1028688 [Tanacetum coccineum]|uniref:Uncharacterized protein n=1 Tax=Tanacetum coccineum TaxID=301880 RepID=A0ABQ5G341_9ASTR